MREVLIVAGEASGDLHASGVAEKLREMDPSLSMAGVGGDRMRSAGVEIIKDYRELAVMGFVEVLRHIPKHAALLKLLKNRMASGNVKALVLIDYPGFNMKVGKAAKDLGVPVIYYVTPQVWAWGAGRLPKLADIIDRGATILPFEEPLLRKHGINATFVGHPLLDRAAVLPSKEDARANLGMTGSDSLSDSDKVLALFPGSRAQEIALHWDDFIATGVEMQRRFPDLKVVISGSPTVALESKSSPFPIVFGKSFDVLRAADVALCKSGTTTLETAIAGTPMALGYRAGRISYQIAKRVVKIPYIGLVNVVAEREIVREFIQDDLEPVKVANELERLLVDTGYRQTMQNNLKVVREKLGEAGAASRVAQMVLEEVK